MWKKGVFFIVTIVFSIQLWSQPQKMLGFNIEDALIPKEEIKHGGPPKDGIPSIDDPHFAKASNYSYFGDDHRILGVYYNGVAKAYPIGILNWHEIVNDRFGEEAVVVTYCPLCGSGIAFEAVVEGQSLEFGVSGLLYNSDVLLYDRHKESLWSQILMKAVTGPFKGKKLEPIPTENTTLGEWKAKHPTTLILTHETGFSRDYKRSPYGDYNQNEKVFFPLANTNRKFHPKELVLGLEWEGQFKAYPFKELKKIKGKKTIDKWQGEKFQVIYDKKSDSARIKNEDGELVPTFTLFWFAWYAFYPDTEVFKYKK